MNLAAAVVDRLPQFRDRVERLKTNTFGEVRNVRKAVGRTGYSFYVRFDDGGIGWFTQAELRVIGFAPASDGANYLYSVHCRSCHHEWQQAEANTGAECDWCHSTGPHTIQ